MRVLQKKTADAISISSYWCLQDFNKATHVQGASGDFDFTKSWAIQMHYFIVLLDYMPSSIIAERLNSSCVLFVSIWFVMNTVDDRNQCIVCNR
jgi:hypothetical protein